MKLREAATIALIALAAYWVVTDLFKTEPPKQCYVQESKGDVIVGEWVDCEEIE